MEHDHDRQRVPWRLDLEHERLWRGTEILHLRPKSFAVLRYLVAHPERLLSKDELVQAVWPDTAVSDGVLTVCMAELRKVLGDTTQTPRQVTGALTAVEDVMPESLLQMIAQQFAALSAETQHVLEAASVAGMASPVAAVAAGVEAADEAVEAACAGLAQRGQFLQAHGVEVWPDGTLTARYGFRHTLHQQVVYDRVPVMRRLRLHRQIGARLEVGYGAQAGERAAELAMHFDRGRLYARAVPYWRQAAEQALRRWAYPEAIGYLQHCLEGLQTLPDTRERAQQELEVQLALGQACSATRGPAAVAVERAFTRAEELCRQVGEVPQRVAVLRGLRELYLGRGEIAAAQALAEQSLSVAQQALDPVLLLEAHVMLGLCAFYAGDAAMVCTHMDRGLTLAGPPRHGVHLFSSRRDLSITGLGHAAVALWVLGYPAQALERIHTALERAQDLSHPWSTTLALCYVAIISLLCGDGPAVQRQAAMLIRLATEQELALPVGQGLILQGWAVAVQGQAAEGLAQMRQGKTILQDAGQRQTLPFFLSLLVEQYGHAGQAEEGLHVLLEALAIAHTQGLRMWEAELQRLRGVLLYQATAPGSAPTAALEAEVESYVRQALDIARRQGAKAFELRAAMSLSRLWQQQGKRAAAHQLLAEIYGWFTEGLDTADLREAAALLNTLT
jgi:predicted ATPase